ncbi:hypothetical protein V6N12_007507 [Hibiscus sabdariffa]|uniref:RNase H type-1 domain-containing protein n=1 Tax=Hibiscus sabdariffa TaxID=183260 RepID=A0ABR2F205_9ROSI
MDAFFNFSLEEWLLDNLNTKIVLGTFFLSLLFGRSQTSLDSWFLKVQLQTDNAQVLKLIFDVSAHFGPYPLIWAIDKLRKRAWVVDFQVIRREANMAVDGIAKAATNLNGSLSVFESIPDHLRHCMQKGHSRSPKSSGGVKIFI